MIVTAWRVPLVLTLGLGALACASSGPPIRSPQRLLAEPTSCVSAIGADTTVYDVSQIDEKPVFRTALKLTYPAQALHERIQGRVVVAAVVNAGGDVDQSSVRIVRHVHPLLDDEARRIVASATLWPACRNGQAVRMRMAVPFDFAMRGPAIKVWQAFAVGMVAGIVGAMARDVH
jgi:TonB family protein